MAVASNGQVFSWGSNSDGQLGHNGQLIPKRIKVLVNSETFILSNLLTYSTFTSGTKNINFGFTLFIDVC